MNRERVFVWWLSVRWLGNSNNRSVDRWVESSVPCELWSASGQHICLCANTSVRAWVVERGRGVNGASVTQNTFKQAAVVHIEVMHWPHCSRVAQCVKQHIGMTLLKWMVVLSTHARTVHFWRSLSNNVTANCLRLATGVRKRRYWCDWEAVVVCYELNGDRE